MFIDVLNNMLTLKFLSNLGQHLLYMLTATFIGFIIGIVFAVISYYNTKLKVVLLKITEIIQNIPSLVMLSLLVIMGTGIGYKPALICLITYSILPVFVNTLTGLLNISEETQLIVYSKNLNFLQNILMKLNIVKANIISGLRMSICNANGYVILTAYVGAGGLGYYIMSGLSCFSIKLILTGAIPTIILGILLDLIFDFIEYKQK